MISLGQLLPSLARRQGQSMLISSLLDLEFTTEEIHTMVKDNPGQLLDLES